MGIGRLTWKDNALDGVLGPAYLMMAAYYPTLVLVGWFRTKQAVGRESASHARSDKTE
jgi:hypothetical protein